MAEYMEKTETREIGTVYGTHQMRRVLLATCLDTKVNAMRIMILTY